MKRGSRVGLIETALLLGSPDLKIDSVLYFAVFSPAEERLLRGSPPAFAVYSVQLEKLLVWAAPIPLFGSELLGLLFGLRIEKRRLGKLLRLDHLVLRLVGAGFSELDSEAPIAIF